MLSTNFSEKQDEQKNRRLHTTSLVLGALSLAVLTITLFQIIRVAVSMKLQRPELFISIRLYLLFLFSLLSLILSLIGFQKARIYTKSGNYATVALIMNGFGFILSIIQILCSILILIFYWNLTGSDPVFFMPSPNIVYIRLL